MADQSVTLFPGDTLTITVEGGQPAEPDAATTSDTATATAADVSAATPAVSDPAAEPAGGTADAAGVVPAPDAIPGVG